MKDYFRQIGALPEGKGTGIASYVAGLIVSLGLTVCSFASVMTGAARAYPQAVFVFALLQFFAQSAWFLHVRTHPESVRERLYVFCAFAFIIGCLVVGSLWIMMHLDSRMAAPDLQARYMQMQ